eukprot:scaffold48881_cov62-Attheya_sp.AAC.2
MQFRQSVSALGKFIPKFLKFPQATFPKKENFGCRHTGTVDDLSYERAVLGLKFFVVQKIGNRLGDDETLLDEGLHNICFGPPFPFSCLLSERMRDSWTPLGELGGGSLANWKPF